MSKRWKRHTTRTGDHAPIAAHTQPPQLPGHTTWVSCSKSIRTSRRHPEKTHKTQLQDGQFENRAVASSSFQSDIFRHLAHASVSKVREGRSVSCFQVGLRLTQSCQISCIPSPSAPYRTAQRYGRGSISTQKRRYASTYVH